MGRPQYEQPDIKKHIKDRLMKMKRRFKGASRKDAFDGWQKAYKEGEPWAQEIHDLVVDIHNHNADFADL